MKLNQLAAATLGLAISSSACVNSPQTPQTPQPKQPKPAKTAVNTEEADYQSLIKEDRAIEDKLEQNGFGTVMSCVAANSACVAKIMDADETLRHSSLFSECSSLKDEDKQNKCIDKVLIKQGKINEVNSFYRQSNSCGKKVLSCMAAKTAKKLRQRKKMQQLFEHPEVKPLKKEMGELSKKLEQAQEAVPSIEQRLCNWTVGEPRHKHLNAEEELKENITVDNYKALHQTGVPFMTPLTSCLTKMRSTADAHPVLSKLYRQLARIKKAILLYDDDSEKLIKCSMKMQNNKADQKEREKFRTYADMRTTANRIDFLSAEVASSAAFLACLKTDQ